MEPWFIIEARRQLKNFRKNPAHKPPLGNLTRAQERLDRLRALTVERGATPGEARSARLKAKRLARQIQAYKEATGRTDDVDVSIMWDGSVALVRPLTKRAQEWIDDFCDVPDWAWMGGSFAVDAHHIGDLIAGMEEAGLAVD